MSTATKQKITNASIGVGPIADRVDRLKASLIDAGVLLVANMPVYLIMWMFGLWDNLLVSIVINGIASATIFLTINFSLLKRKGQTFGKKKMNIRIVGRNNQPMEIDELLLKRYAPIWLVCLIPVLGPLACLASVLFIFRDSNACLHDDIANTKVVPA